MGLCRNPAPAPLKYGRQNALKSRKPSAGPGSNRRSLLLIVVEEENRGWSSGGG